MRILFLLLGVAGVACSASPTAPAQSREIRDYVQPGDTIGRAIQTDSLGRVTQCDLLIAQRYAKTAPFYVQHWSCPAIGSFYP